MKLLKILLTIVFVYIFAGFAQAQVEWITNPNNGHEYALLTPEENGEDWWVCESLAISYGAHLVTIRSQEEQNWLITAFVGYEFYWIGFTDEAVEGEWKWIGGEPITYTNWFEGSPDDNHWYECPDGEDYGYMNSMIEGKWDDLCCNAPYNPVKAIIEKIGGINTPPYAPTLLTPADGSVVEEGMVTFSWINNGDPDGDAVGSWFYAVGPWSQIFSFSSGAGGFVENQEISVTIPLYEIGHEWAWSVYIWDPLFQSNPYYNFQQPFWHFTVVE